MMIKSSTLDVPFQIAFTNGVHAGVADLPIVKGGAGAGFGPHELLEAALATCLVMTARMYAEKNRLPLASASCEVLIDRSAVDSVVLGYVLLVEGDLTTEQKRQIQEAAARCPVARTLTGQINLQTII